MNTHPLGLQGPLVSAMGLGCMGLSGVYGLVDRKEAIATIHEALDAGINLLDTGDFYNSGHNELLIRDALAQRKRQSVLLSVKFGELRDPAGGWHGKDCRPEAVRNFLAHSLNRLGTDYIDIYRPARLDPAVPIEETIGAIADMVKAGYVRHIGLSEVGPDTIRRAAAVHPIVDLQIEYSLVSRRIEDGILETCRELGIGLTIYGILSRGLLSSHFIRDRSLQGDIRSRMPRFAPGNLDHNLSLVQALEEIACSKSITIAQLAMAWVLSRGDDLVPLIGAKRPEQLSEALGALEVSLTQEELECIEAAVPRNAAAGERYPEQMMAHLDSETTSRIRDSIQETHKSQAQREERTPQKK